VPHRSFDAARRAYEAQRDPVTFDYGGETFTVVPDPTLGDTFELMDAPEITPETEQQAVRALVKFVRRMLPPEDRARFDQAHYRIPSTEGPVIIEMAAWIAEQVTTRPTVPPASSSGGRRTTGPRSTTRPAGKRRSS